MLQIISNQQKIVKKNDGFGIEILFPIKELAPGIRVFKEGMYSGNINRTT